MRAWIGLVVVAGLGACTRDTDYNRTRIGDSDVIIARPSSRIVAERVRFDGSTVICTEPSPDVAIALARSGSIAGGGSVPEGAKVNISATVASGEQLTALRGRTAGVVALRDGLYAACQAYASGIIGQNAYALILSQYGRLLREVVAGEAAGQRPPTGPADPVAEGVMLVSCIEEFDPTRARAGEHNPLLRDFCANFMRAKFDRPR